jgi:predicted DNA binding protein
VKSLRLRLSPTADARHPMHGFVVRREGFSRARLVAEGESRSDRLDADDGPDGPQALLFHIEGTDPDREAYAAALSDVESVTDFALDRRHDVLYAYVLEHRSPFDRRLTATFSRLDLVVVPPVDFVADGSIRLTVVGRADAVQSAVTAVPPAIDTDVRRVGEFETGVVASSNTAGLTTRQREAVEAAVDVGYYGSPREGDVGAVATALGCSTGTAAEHLRKAEARVMRTLVGRPGGE